MWTRPRARLAGLLLHMCDLSATAPRQTFQSVSKNSCFIFANPPKPRAMPLASRPIISFARSFSAQVNRRSGCARNHMLVLVPSPQMAWCRGVRPCLCVAELPAHGAGSPSYISRLPLRLPCPFVLRCGMVWICDTSRSEKK